VNIVEHELKLHAKINHFGKKERKYFFGYGHVKSTSRKHMWAI
jgi:hypothetical protein